MPIDSRRAGTGHWRSVACDRVSPPECSTAPRDSSASVGSVGWDPAWLGPTREWYGSTRADAIDATELAR